MRAIIGTSLMHQLVYVVVFIFGVALNQYYGNFGYMPLDLSLIYNGAWRVLNGQVPYRDFWLPHSTLPIMVQAAMFWALGMSWTTYVLQASLLNGLFAACITWAGVRFGMALPFAGLFGVIAGAIAYPPVGAPLMDNHAAIFCSILILVVLLGVLNPARRGLWWLLVPPVAIFAFFSKQSPTVFVVPFCAVAILATAWSQRATRDLILVVISSIVSLLIVGLLFWYFGISWEMFRIEAIDSAFETAKYRTGTVVEELVEFFKLSFGGVPVFFIASVLTLVALVGAAWMRKFETAVLSLFAAASFGIFFMFAIITFNQPGTGLALLALSLLLGFAALVQTVTARPAVYVLAILPLIIAATIQTQWTSTRYLNDFDQASLGSSVDGALISPQLARLRWTIPSGHPGERNAAHYRELLTSLAGRSTPAVVISDSVLEPLIGQYPVASPLCWVEIVCYPASDSPARAVFDNQFKRAIVAAHSDLVVMDGVQTWMGTKLDSFPWLNACLRRNEGSTIGKFSLMPLDIECIRASL